MIQNAMQTSSIEFSSKSDSIKDKTNQRSTSERQSRERVWPDPGSMLMISQSSMLTAQSGPISMSFVALSAHATAAISPGGTSPRRRGPKTLNPAPRTIPNQPRDPEFHQEHNSSLTNNPSLGPQGSNPYRIWANRPPRFGAERHQSGIRERSEQGRRGKVVGESGVGLNNWWDWLEDW
jgi:hypothetical protein